VQDMQATSLLKWDTMENKRQFKRFSMKLDAKYSREDTPGKWKECSVTNISRGGVGIIVHLQERIPTGVLVPLEIMFPTKEEPIKAIGVLRWIEKKRKEINFKVGIEFINIHPAELQAMLDYADDD